MRERTPLSDAAKDVAGRDFRILDLYASGAFDLGDIPLDVRVGNQVLNWGESTFVPNGINVINPIDVSRLRTPGSELRDALVPVPMAYVAIEPVPDLSVEGLLPGWLEEDGDRSGRHVFLEQRLRGSGWSRSPSCTAELQRNFGFCPECPGAGRCLKRGRCQSGIAVQRRRSLPRDRANQRSGTPG